jgi:polar amino acid transport system permease protein
MIPPANNLLIELLKGTALVSIMGVADIAFGASLVRNATGESAPVYTIILVMYFVIAFVLTRGMRVLERHAKAGIGQAPAPRAGLPGLGSPRTNAVSANSARTNTASSDTNTTGGAS